jgi:hypothetical protein
MEPVVDPRCSHAANEPREMVMRTFSRTHADGKITVKKYEPAAYEEPGEGPALVRIHVEEDFGGDIDGSGVG